ncbi:jg2012 [Pararge aegeria aegeria]|uniref:Jg2012 protein n=1 Tax=Pararge aegeria aegeria TaxID=348720 RepID=A0A8S4SB04_9NEOP|nr:jg2012 [Pararge aegeria aegeria]
MLSDASSIENYRITNVEPSAYYLSEFITQEEEKYLLSNIYAAPKPKWTQLSNRRLQNWGGLPHNRGMIAEEIPKWLQKYLNNIDSLNVMDGKMPNHVLVNEYLPGQGILPHLDGSLFYPTITTISVASHTILKFLEPNSAENPTLKPVFSLLLEPRSLLILKDKLFHYYLHCIEEVNEDCLDDSIVNLNMCSDKYSSGATESECGKKIGVQGKEKQDAGPGEGNGEGNKSSLVLGVYQSGDKFELTAAAAEIDQKSGGKLSRHLNEMSSQLSLGKALVVTDVVPQHGAVALSSLGPKDPGYNTLEDLDETRKIHRKNSFVEQVAYGFLRSIVSERLIVVRRFEEFKSDRQPTPRLSLYGPEGQQAWAEGSILGRAQNWARFLSDMPANKMTPVDLAQVAINVVAVIPLCENMVSGQCMKVGDVVRALNGLSLQIEDTDLEGRLALADALVYGQAQFKPALVIDVATLTHDPAVDLRNKGSGTATPCIGAAFLKNFICGDWLHLDMTGVGRVAPEAGAAPTYLAPRRMSGRPTRTLVAFLAAAAGQGGGEPGQ